jgi:UDP-N-acetylglucosamine 3-dehydrogenase
MTELRAAVVGIGQMGRHHARVYRAIEGVDLVAVADTNREALERATRGTLAQAYTEYQVMLDEQKPDLVSVAVPTRLHAEVVAETIRRGIHTLVEKPLAATIEEGQQIAALAEQHGVLLSVGHIERFNPAIVEVKRRLDERELGQLYQMHARRLSPFPARIQDVGVILDLATHDIDMMRFLLGADVERLFAEVTRKVHRSHEDLLSGLIRFSNDVLGVLDINWLTPTKIRQLTVTGGGGMYLIDYIAQDLYWYKNANVAAEWDAISVMRGPSEGDMVKIQIQKREPLHVELETFVAAVREGRPAPVSGRDGIETLNLAQKLIESGLTHRVVSCR